jgi:flagellar biosynthesis/type III secretory pathway chaperone
MTSPAFAVGALLGALGVETGLQEELGALLQREHGLLMAMSLDDLLRLEAEKETVLERTRSQTQEVKACMRALAAASSIPETEATSLSKLANYLTEPDRTRFRQAQKRLLSITEAVREQNRANDRLIHGSLTYVSQYLNLLRSLVGAPTAYRSNGALPEHPESGRILTLKG